MRSLAERRLRVPALLLTLVAVLAIPGVAAAETTQSDLVLIRAEDVVTEDLFAAGNTIQIAGRIEGDLVASSLGELRIDGTIEGSVNAVASRVVIAGVVDGSVRVVASEVVIEGTIGGDLATAARRVSIEPRGKVGRDLLIANWTTEVAGDVGRNIDGFARNLTIAGRITQNVDVDVTNLLVLDTARIDGDLGYRSANEGDVASGAAVGGSILDRRPLSPNVRLTGLGFLIRVLMIVFGAALGLAMIWATGQRSVAAGRALRTRPVASVGQGLAVAAIPPLLLGGVATALSYMAPESAFPLLAVAIPFLLAVIGTFALASIITPLPPALAIGSKMASERSAYAQFLAGFGVLSVLMLLPYIGSYVIAGVLVAGLGAWITRTPKDPDQS